MGTSRKTKQLRITGVDLGNNRQMRRKKICVEDCHRLSATRLASIPLFHLATQTWIQGKVLLGKIAFSRVTELMVTLRYSVNEIAMDYPVEMNTTSLPWDSVRYWFTCPSCSRRVAHLYLPNGRMMFACRHCYNLTYRSSQTNGSWRRFFKEYD